MSKAGRLLGLLAACLACACATTAETGPAPNVGIDHIILGVADLDKGIAELERRTGVRAAYGGAHPGRGTRNALISLGPYIYLEILAPDPAQAVGGPDLDALRTLSALKPVGWAVNTDDAEALRRRLESKGLRLSPLVPGSRARPDGTLLEWATFVVTEPEHEYAPFFIRWADMSRHPARTSPAGCAFKSLAIDAADPAPLESILAPLKLKVRVGQAYAPQMALTLSCPRGEVAFR